MKAPRLRNKTGVCHDMPHCLFDGDDSNRADIREGMNRGDGRNDGLPNESIC